MPQSDPHNLKETTMETKFHAPLNGAGLRPQATPNLPSVEDHVGLVGRITARRAVAREATRALTDLKTAGLQAQERIARTEIAMVESAVKGALVAQGMETIGALVVDMAAKTGVVQATLSTTGSAERLTHVANRQDAHEALDRRVAQSRLSAEEATALKSYDDAELVRMIDLTNKRIAKSQEVVELCHDRSLAGIAKSTDAIS